MARSATRRVDAARRAEIGAEKRSRTKAALLEVARELFGHEEGRDTRIEDVCEKARIARGTFYNYFGSMDQLQDELARHLSLAFDDSVHLAFSQIDSAAGRTAAAIRYYLGNSARDRKWGWAMVNTGMGRTLFGEGIAERSLATIREGVESGEFTIASATIGRDILLGSSLAAVITLLRTSPPEGYVEQIAQHVLMALGVAEDRARALSVEPLPALAAL